jgi:chemotaxis protein methyltransferase CheR
MQQEDFTFIKQKVRELINIDLDNYARNQMMRRLDGFLARNKVSDVIQYFQLLQKDLIEREKLQDFLTINVSEFFRDVQFFNILKEKILPPMLKRNLSLNIWSAGCSNGAEIYSVVMILKQLSPYRHHRILATDIDNKILKQAIAGGPYKASDIKNVPEEKIATYFNILKDEYWIKEDLHKKVIFKQQDLTRDIFESNFDLIICRNVIIYFSDAMKKELRMKFLDALKTNGILFAGATETMLDAEDIGFQRIYTCFYQKNGAGVENKVLAVSHT